MYTNSCNVDTCAHTEIWTNILKSIFKFQQAVLLTFHILALLYGVEECSNNNTAVIHKGYTYWIYVNKYNCNFYLLTFYCFDICSVGASLYNLFACVLNGYTIYVHDLIWLKLCQWLISCIWTFFVLKIISINHSLFDFWSTSWIKFLCTYLNDCSVHVYAPIWFKHVFCIKYNVFKPVECSITKIILLICELFFWYFQGYI